jgi:trehalose 6-phosphate synthase
MFAEAVVSNASDGDVVWIHDYHLMLLPSMLAESLRGSNIQMGFSIHTAFPNSDSFSILPARQEILRSLLWCKLIGFHTSEYANAFMESCAKFLWVIPYNDFESSVG